MFVYMLLVAQESHRLAFLSRVLILHVCVLLVNAEAEMYAPRILAQIGNSKYKLYVPGVDVGMRFILYTYMAPTHPLGS